MVYSLIGIDNADYLKQMTLMKEGLSAPARSFLDEIEELTDRTVYMSIVAEEFNSTMYTNESDLDRSLLHRNVILPSRNEMKSLRSILKNTLLADEVTRYLVYRHGILLDTSLTDRYVNTFTTEQLLVWRRFTDLVNHRAVHITKKLMMSPAVTSEVFDTFGNGAMWTKDDCPYHLLVNWFVNQHVPVEERFKRAVACHKETLEMTGDDGIVMLNRLKVGAAVEALRQELADEHGIDPKMPISWVLTAIS